MNHIVGDKLSVEQEMIHLIDHFKKREVSDSGTPGSRISTN